MQAPKSTFIRVKCEECGTEQNIFGCASTEVKCENCRNVLLKPSGGKAKVLCKIVKVLS